eukprot:358516-Chlamydomonas_euryale.AAC.4
MPPSCARQGLVSYNVEVQGCSTKVAVQGCKVGEQGRAGDKVAVPGWERRVVRVTSLKLTVQRVAVRNGLTVTDPPRRAAHARCMGAQQTRGAWARWQGAGLGRGARCAVHGRGGRAQGSGAVRGAWARCMGAVNGCGACWAVTGGMRAHASMHTHTDTNWVRVRPHPHPHPHPPPHTHQLGCPCACACSTACVMVRAHIMPCGRARACAITCKRGHLCKGPQTHGRIQLWAHARLTLSTGHATSSISMLVPASRAAPTIGMRPLRTGRPPATAQRGSAKRGCRGVEGVGVQQTQQYSGTNSPLLLGGH